MPETKHAFKRLAELGVETVAIVDQRLLTGDTPSNVAAWLQNELKVFLDIKLSSLKKNLERYRAIDLKDKVIEDIKNQVLPTNTAKLFKSLSALDELTELVSIQKSRFQKVVVRESQMPNGLLLKQVSDEGKLLKEMLVELGKLQLETGVLARAPKKVSGSITDPDGNTSEFSWTEEQDQLFKQIESTANHLDQLPVEAVADA